MRPRIGITSWHRKDPDGLERWESIRESYTGAVLAAGGLPLILPIAGEHPAVPAEYLEHLTWAAGNKKKRAFVKAGEAGMVNTPEDRRSYIRVNPRTCADITG